MKGEWPANHSKMHVADSQNGRTQKAGLAATPMANRAVSSTPGMESGLGRRNGTRFFSVWEVAMRALRATSRLTPHVMVIVCIACSAVLQATALYHRFSLSGLLVALLLIGGPLSSYAFYVEVKRSSRPALSTLMLAIAAFFAMISLAIADLGAPISAALSRNASTAINEQAMTGRETVSAVEKVQQATSFAGPVGTNAKGDVRIAAGKGKETSSVSTLRAPAAQQAKSSGSATKVDEIPAASTDGPPYSLYDMLSLLGMVATVSLIALGALVPEETKMLERRREDQLLLLDAFGDFASKVHDFHAKSGSTEYALAVRHAANRLIILFGPSDAAGIAKGRIRDLLAALRLSRVIEGGYTKPGELPTLTDIVDKVEGIATLIENQ